MKIPKDRNISGNRRAKGRRGEELAASYLRRKGLKVIARNYRCPLGEIDIICREGDTVVFVEVRSKTITRFGLPQESISFAKRRRLTRLAQWYLRETHQDNLSARFDVVAIIWGHPKPELIWIPDAFEMVS